MNKPKNRLYYLLLIAASIFCADLSANNSNDIEIHSLDDIEASVRDFVVWEQSDSDGVNVQVNSLDKRLRLAKCSDRLQTFWSPGSRRYGRVTVQVACEGPKSWRIHVQSTVTYEGTVWVLGKGVRRGEILKQSDLEQKVITVGANNHAFRNVADPVKNLDRWLGYEFSKRVTAGTVLDEGMLAPAKIVNKGEPVLIVYETVGLQLQTKGVALSEGAKGSPIKIRNTSSGKTVDAIVLARGLVQLLQ
jgi:flagella basal body P-ring formation protein FlgA